MAVKEYVLEKEVRVSVTIENPDTDETYTLDDGDLESAGDFEEFLGAVAALFYGYVYSDPNAPDGVFLSSVARPEFLNDGLFHVTDAIELETKGA